MPKKKKTSPKQQPISPAKYIIEAARKLPITECLINTNWEIDGLAQVFVRRKKYNENYIVGFYLVDLYCLGVRYSEHHHDMTESEWQIELNRRKIIFF